MDYEDPDKYGEAFDTTKLSIDIIYGLKLSSDTTTIGKPNTLPLYLKLGEELEYNYTKDVKRTGDITNVISWKRMAHYRPISRPYGETMINDEGTSIGGVKYATKYLPRADELTAYVDLNEGPLQGEVLEYIRMGNMIETPTPSWTPTSSWTPTPSWTATPTESWTPTISYTPTESQTPTVSYTPTLTGTPAPTPSYTDTKTPDLESVSIMFRSLWTDSSNAYFIVKSDAGRIGMKFRYRKFINDFYEKNKDVDSLGFGWFDAKSNNGYVFNPIRKIVLDVDNIVIPDHTLDINGYINNVYRDHLWVDKESTFTDIEMTESYESWGNMVLTNEDTFEYALTDGIKIRKKYEDGNEVIKGIEFNIPFNEVSLLSSDNEQNERYEKFINTKNTSLVTGYDNPFDCVYFIFEGSMENSNITDLEVHASTQEQVLDNGIWQFMDNPYYVSPDGVRVISHVNPDYLYSIETPTPSFTPTQTNTETISFTPTPTMTYTETISLTPTPTMTYTETISFTPTLTCTPTVTETITDTLNLFNINRDKGVNIIGELQIIKRDGTIATANRFFNIGLEPNFIDFDI